MFFISFDHKQTTAMLPICSYLWPKSIKIVESCYIVLAVLFGEVMANDVLIHSYSSKFVNSFLSSHRMEGVRRSSQRISVCSLITSIVLTTVFSKTAIIGRRKKDYLFLIQEFPGVSFDASVCRCKSPLREIF